MHAKGSGAYGTFTVTQTSQSTPVPPFSVKSENKQKCFVRFSTVAGERGAADAERDIRGFAMKFYTEEGNWDLLVTILPYSSYVIHLIPGSEPCYQTRSENEYA